MDDIGRIVIPRDIRNTLRWMGGDEIEIILNNDNTILLRRYQDNTAQQLKELSSEWQDDPEVKQKFLDLISLIESKN
jgi:AbrB family looped-hinge helix DNA binding protein